MKKFIKLTTIAIIMLVFCSANNSRVEGAKPKRMYIDVTSDVTSSKISWDKKKVSYYEVYRAKVTKRIKKSNYSLKESKYKKIAKVSKKKKTYVDKKVKTGEYYAYVVYGYRKKNGKYKKVYSSFLNSDYMIYDYVGLSRPSVNEFNTEESVQSDSDYVALNISYSRGAKPKKYIVYRKAAGESKFKKIKATNIGKLYDSEIVVYRDDNVKTHVQYEYKVKSYKKVGKKKYYSKFSNVFKVTPCNKNATFKAESMTEAGKNIKDIVIKLVSDKDNGKIEFFKNYYAEECTYKYQKDTFDTPDFFSANLIQYSYNNSDWINIESSKALLEPGKTIYLKYRLSNFEDDDSVIEYGSNSAEQSEITLTSAKYYGPNGGQTYMRIDLTEGAAFASQYWDE